MLWVKIILYNLGLKWIEEGSISKPLFTYNSYNCFLTEQGPTITLGVSPRHSHKAPHSLPVRMSYGVPFVSPKSDLSFINSLKHIYALWWHRSGSTLVSSLIAPSHYLSKCWLSLTHWGRVTHICVSKLTTTGSDNGLSPGRRQAIIWTNDGILLIGPLGTNFSEILIGIQTFSLKKMHLKMSSAKWRPFVSASMC